MNAREIAERILEMSEFTCADPKTVWDENVDEATKADHEYEEIAALIEELKAERRG